MRSFRVGRVERVEELAAELDRLGLGGGRPAVVLVGGAGGMGEDDLRRVEEVLRLAVLPVLEGCAAAVVDGGSDSGVMQVVGRARAAAGARFPLVGVAAEGTVTWPGDGELHAGGVVEIEPNHTHVILVPGQSWGDESPWLGHVAAAIAGDHRSVTVVVNGGEITYDDIDWSLAGQRPTLVLAGTGRAADAIAAAVAGQDSESRAERVAGSPLIRILDVGNPAGIAEALAAALGQPGS
ncbi:MAG TPA: hypothetical protein VGX25_05725 [Actinophytocola sp.]|uniref:hypothetical protein n=1 Tax=Actinophytocola sp. TaxID=1872138 RepID=UPI002DDD4E60|nr:hypothetical protein [Actinophytocola sp.]HEV2778883.1 hypothetical protein [Actinophytocola sp.]